jgi:tRNA nucleotidyltransferase (CCA-adding enzyme)
MQIELTTLPRERVGGEWEKLLASDQPSRGVWFLWKSGALVALHMELAALPQTRQDSRYHPEGDVLTHTMMALDEAAKLVKNLPVESRRAVMWAVLLHDVAKPWTTVTQENGAITSHDHANEGGPAARRVMVDQFNVDLDTVAKVGKLVEEHMVPKLMAKDGAGASAVRRLAKRLEPATMEELIAVSRADSLGRTTSEAIARRTDGEDWLEYKAKNLGVEREGPKPLLMGRHLLELGMQPGKGMGAILRQVFELQLDGRVTTLEEALEAAGSVERGMA